MNGKTSYNYVKNCLKPSNKPNEKTKEVEELLDLVRFIRRNNRCTMDELIGKASDLEYDEHTLITCITILDTFQNTRSFAKRLKDVQQTELFITRMISSLERLKYLSDRGELYYRIIVSKICDEGKIKDESIAKEFKIGRSTYYLKRYEALNLTYEVWFGAGLLEESALWSDVYKSAKKMLQDEGNNTNENF